MTTDTENRTETNPQPIAPLVDRLRAGHQYSGIADPLDLEAADVIERLNKDVSIVHADICAENDNLKAENGRLQDALQAAPRPQPGASEDWQVTYMDWFFKTRITALGDQKPSIDEIVDNWNEPIEQIETPCIAGGPCFNLECRPLGCAIKRADEQIAGEKS